MSQHTDQVRTFRELHESGCFVLPNPWDLGSARVLEQLGFPALATTSSGFAWSLGRPDNGVSLEEALAHLRSISQGVTVPVNADFEGGFAREPEGVAANVAAATATGVAGLSIEDSTGEAASPLYDFGSPSSASGRPGGRSTRAAPACCSPPAARAFSSAGRTSPRPFAA